MKILMKTIFFLGLLLFMNCDNTATGEKETEILTDSTATELITNEENLSNNETKNVGKVVVATYDGATTYAAVSDYKFINEKDELLIIRGNTYGEEETIEVPDNMLEEITEELEGPPGANPDLVGKKFKIHCDANDTPIKIELIE